MARTKPQQDETTAPADGIEKTPVEGDTVSGDGSGVALPPASPGAHPIEEAFAHLVAARAALVRARDARGKGVEVVADAGVLARSLLLIGGALPDDSAPWTLAHALTELSGMPDEDGTELFTRFTAFVTGALMATRRRKALNLPAHGLERFADAASKHGTRKLVIEALDARRADDHAARERANAVEFDRRKAARAAGPSEDVKARNAAAKAAQAQIDAELEARIGPEAMARRGGRLPPNPLLTPPDEDKV